MPIIVTASLIEKRPVPNSRTHNLSDTPSLVRYGIYLGLGWTHEEIAEAEGVVRQTVYRHVEKGRIEVEKWRQFAESVSARTVAKRIQEIEEKQDLKQKLSAKAYQRLQGLLERGEDDGLTLATLKEALDRTEGKAVDRKAVLNLNQTEVTHKLSPETEARLAHLDRLLPQYDRLQLPAPEATEAEVIEP